MSNKMTDKINLDLKKFDPSAMSSDSVCVMLGKRGSGKSYLLKNLLYYHKDIPVGTVISGTESANSFYKPIVPPIFIHDEYEPEITSRFMKRQKKIKKQSNYEDLDYRAYLIFDDCLYDSSWQKDKQIREVFMNGRHYGIMFMLTSQFPLGIPPILRTNVDYVFILRENIYSNRKRLYEHWAGMFPTFEMFCTTMDQCTENFECLVIDNKTKSNKLEDIVFWYKAEDMGNFRMGPPEVWEYCMENYTIEEEESDDDEEITISTYRSSSKKGPKVNVKKYN